MLIKLLKVKILLNKYLIWEVIKWHHKILYKEQKNLHNKILWKYTKFFDKELLDENLNLIYAVGKGSYNKPGMICIEYKYNDSD